jgi:hypothetical protein
MDSFVVPASTPEEFVARIEREVRAQDFDSIVSPRLIGGQLEVRFSYLGTSVLLYDLVNSGDGFRATLAHRRMSPFHAPFRAGFDSRFDEVLRRLGAHAE